MNATVKFGGKSARVGGGSGILHSKSDTPVAESDSTLLFPMEPRKALESFSKYLLEFEKQEILDYEKIYFFNIKQRTELKGPMKCPNGIDNNGFDNDKNEYICQMGNHFAYRYEIVSYIGKGSFGQVLKCFDHKTKETVALKILRNKKRLYK